MLVLTLYTAVMSLKDRHTNQVDNNCQDAELNSEASHELMNVDNVETGFYILASMIAEFHLRRKDSCKHSLSDEDPKNLPH